MRLDKFLKISRLLKRRTLAAQACKLRAVKVNGLEAKASKQVKEGDILELDMASVYLKVKVERVPQGCVSKKDAQSLYSLLEERKKDWREELWE
ncbi:MAG: RNA-binding S4 domain-containing protein [Aquificota bacterium]|nr:MAG: RNA-binding S4 domain-containing protein [Aquificota bacterium]